MKTVAGLPPQEAAEVAKLLEEHHILYESRIVEEGSGLETTEVLVGDSDYDRACELIENWQAAIATKRHQRLTRHCPKCGSQEWEPVEDAQYAKADLTVFRCKACGCMIPG